MQAMPTQRGAAKFAQSTVSSTLLSVALVVFALTVLATLAGRWVAQSPARDAQVVSERLLRFEDGPDGSISVLDASSGQPVEVLRGEQGFVRGTLRGFARERRRAGVSSAAPLALQSLGDKRLVLRDPLSTHRVDLGAFGPDNAAAFARWLPHNPASASAAVNAPHAPHANNPTPGRQP
jgi:putative photosynthetic complex assembly protein